MNKSKFKVSITKSITIDNSDGTSISLEEGEWVRISKSSDHDEIIKNLPYFELIPCEFLGVTFSVTEINDPNGHGSHYPLELDNDKYNLYIRHFNLINGLYKFTTVFITNH